MFNDSCGSLEELSQPEDNIYFVFTLLYKLVLFYFYSDYHSVDILTDNLGGILTGYFYGNEHNPGLFHQYCHHSPGSTGSRLSKN